jgi:hypothetical protein
MLHVPMNPLPGAPTDMEDGIVLRVSRAIGVVVVHGYFPQASLSPTVCSLSLQEVLDCVYTPCLFTKELSSDEQHQVVGIVGSLYGEMTEPGYQRAKAVVDRVGVAVLFSFQHFRVVVAHQDYICELVTCDPAVEDNAAFREIVSHIAERYLRTGLSLSSVLKHFPSCAVGRNDELPSDVSASVMQEGESETPVNAPIVASDALPDFLGGERLTVRSMLLGPLRSEEQAVAWLQQIGWLPSMRSCACGREMRLYSRGIGESVRFYFRCIFCDCTVSLTHDTIFFGHKLQLNRILLLLLHYWNKHTVEEAAREAECGVDAASEWYYKFRSCCVKNIVCTDQKIGGYGKVVECDEALFRRTKYNKQFARRKEQLWVLGGVERSEDPGVPPRVFYEVVPDRTAETLIAAIERHVAVGTILVQVGWTHCRLTNPFLLYG